METKIKLASLDVYLTDSREIPSHLKQLGPKVFELYVNPLVDEKILENFKSTGKIQGSTLELMQNIVAHELGHFVAFLTKCPTHARTAGMEKPITVNGVTEELSAWKARTGQA